MPSLLFMRLTFMNIDSAAVGNSSTSPVYYMFYHMITPTPLPRVHPTSPSYPTSLLTDKQNWHIQLMGEPFEA